jgi:hypothetical protein
MVPDPQVVDTAMLDHPEMRSECYTKSALFDRKDKITPLYWTDL